MGKQKKKRMLRLFLDHRCLHFHVMFWCLPSLLHFICRDYESALLRSRTEVLRGHRCTPSASKSKCLCDSSTQTEPERNRHRQTLGFCSVFSSVCVCVPCNPKLKSALALSFVFPLAQYTFIALFVFCGASALIFWVVWRSLPMAEQTQASVGESVLFADPGTFQRMFAPRPPR